MTESISPQKPSDDNSQRSGTAAAIFGGIWRAFRFLVVSLWNYINRKVAEQKEDRRQRLAEPALTDDENTILSRYIMIAKHLTKNEVRQLPPVPAPENALNRREIRAFVSDPGVFRAIEKGEAIAAKIQEEAAEKWRMEQERAQAEQAQRTASALATLEQRLPDIEKYYGNTLNEVSISVDQLEYILPAGAISQAGNIAFEDSRSSMNKNWLAGQSTDIADLGGKMLYKAVRQGAASSAISSAQFRRSLVSMNEQERAALRLGDILLALGCISSEDLLRARVPIVWNKGECLVDVGGSYGSNLRKREAALSALRSLVSSYFGEPVTGTEIIKSHLAKAMEPGAIAPAIQTVLERYIVSGARWMSPKETATFAPDQASPSALRLGMFSGTRQEFLFDRNESLVTIAAPGTGKSQAHVLRNLLYLQAPAVVLDIKGEMREKSVTWRAANVGPVYVFAPGSTTSIRYNPLDHVPDDVEVAWDYARRLADLLVIPASQSSGGDDYFESRARDMITTAVLDVALSEPDDRRSMATVLDRLYVSDDDKFIDWCTHLESLGVAQLRRQASALRGMPPKQREGIMDSARRQLEIWQSPAIERLSAATDFHADMLRQENATLYICVPLDDIRKYASVLRVIIGQTVHRLCNVAPETSSLPVTFFLDELPRLGRMDVIEEALDVGRGYGVRLWMFCQNIGQLSTAYPNADGMLKNCAVRAFMNPDEQTAHTLSHNIGLAESLLDGIRRPLAEASRLSGPDFADKVLVFSRSSHTAQLDKCPAFADPVCVDRMTP